jgi:ribosomal protein S17
MDNTILIAIITSVGAFLGVLVSSKYTKNIQVALIQQQMEDLIRKVEKHNSLVERMYKIESKVAILEKRMDLDDKE